MVTKDHCLYVASSGAVLFIPQIVLLRGVSITFTTKAMYEPTSVSIHPNLTEIAVGGNVCKDLVALGLSFELEMIRWLIIFLVYATSVLCFCETMLVSYCKYQGLTL